MKIFLTDKRGHTLHEFDDAKMHTAQAATSIITHAGKYFQFNHTVKGGGAVSFSEAYLLNYEQLQPRPIAELFEEEEERLGR